MFARNIFFPYNYAFMTDKLTNILILKPSALGDIVLALPALTALRRSFPDAKISWLIRPEFAPLLENLPHLDKIITFDRKILGKACFSLKAFGALKYLISELELNMRTSIKERCGTKLSANCLYEISLVFKKRRVITLSPRTFINSASVRIKILY